MKKKSTMALLALLLFISSLCTTLSAAYKNNSYEALLQSLAKIYRHARIRQLFLLCTPRGKRHYKNKIKRVGLVRFKKSLRAIGRRIIAATLDEIYILKDGTMKIKFSFHLKYGRRVYKKRSRLRLKKINNRFYIDGE